MWRCKMGLKKSLKGGILVGILRDSRKFSHTGIFLKLKKSFQKRNVDFFSHTGIFLKLKNYVLVQLSQKRIVD